MEKGKLDMKTKRQITKKFALEYKKLPRAEKSKVIEYLVATNNWTRKHAIKEVNKVATSLSKPGRPKTKYKYRKKRYNRNIVPVLEALWKVSFFTNTKSLYSTRLDLYDCLERFGEFKKLKVPVPNNARDTLEKISESTLARLLKPAIDANKIRGRSTTKAGDLLKNSIKVRRASDEMENEPGFIEGDTVAHCGHTLKGEFIRTLTLTDVYNSWTENIAIRNNSHRYIKEGLETGEGRFPYKIKGYDFDNGSEFINHDIVKWANKKDLYFTRSRPYRKNDNAHVEQKNNDLVRRLVGYNRYDTPKELKLMNELYELSSKFYNGFRAIQKAKDWKEVKGGRKRRIYDNPRTPLQRVIESKVLSINDERRLIEEYKNINPVELLRGILKIQNKLKTSKNYVKIPKSVSAENIVKLLDKIA
jgi:hypothetical protein